MTAMTKAQLAADNAALRAELSALRTQLEATRTSHHDDHVKVHEYADIITAQQNCKRLVSTPLNSRYVFTQIGTRVIARAR